MDIHAIIIICIIVYMLFVYIIMNDENTSISNKILFLTRKFAAGSKPKSSTQ